MLSHKEILQQDDIGLFDLWKKLHDGWRYIAVSVVLGVLGGFVAILISPVMYQATTIIQPGLVGAMEIEPTNTAREQLKAPVFVLEAARQAGDAKLVQTLAEGDGKLPFVIKALNVKGTNMIELKTLAENSDAAKKINETLLAQLVVRHEAKSLPMKEKIKSDIDSVKAKLLLVEKEFSSLSKAPSAILVLDSQFAPYSQLAFEKNQKQAEIFLLQQRLTNLELLLVPPATFSTHALDVIYTPSAPVSPNRSLLLLVGLFGGLVIGVISVFFVDSWRSGKLLSHRNSLK